MSRSMHQVVKANARALAAVDLGLLHPLMQRLPPELMPPIILTLYGRDTTAPDRADAAP